MNCTKKLLTGLAITLLWMGVSQAAVIKLIGDGIATDTIDAHMKRITSDYHMTADNEYHLDGIIIVASGVTLTIDPGTVIRGWNEADTTQVNRPGCLIISRGAKIYANGTAQKPIIFTDRWDNNVPGQTAGIVTRTWIYRAGGSTSVTLTNHPYDYSKIGNHHGYWGGLVLCGNAFVNWNKSSAGTVGNLGQSSIWVEGIGSAANTSGGGNNDDDSSGVVKYVNIRYGGYTLENGSEINGLTLYGVGRGTELHHVEVYNNQDDGIEWFGGTVNGKYLVAWGAGDDTFDSDAGFRGKNQFLFGVQQNLGGKDFETGCSDKGMEMDGAENVPVANPSTTGAQEPFSASAWYNLTLVGWDSIATSEGISRNGALVMRDNASPQIKNSVFLNFGVFGALIENVSDRGDFHSFYRFNTDNTSAYLPTTSLTTDGVTIERQYLYQAQKPGKQACIQDCVFYINGTTRPTADEIIGTGGTAAKPTMGDKGGKGPIYTGGENFDFMSSANNNVDLIPEEAPLPIKGLTTTAYDSAVAWGSAVFASTALANSLAGNNPSVIDPRANGSALTAANAVPSDGFLTPVTYRGAFDANNNWAQGWTTIAKLGAFGTYVPVPEDNTGTVVTNTITLTQVVTNDINGLVYETSSATPSTGTSVAVAGFTTAVVSYQIATAGTYELQTCTDLAAADWSVLKTFNAAANTSVSVSDIAGGVPPNASDSRFFKLIKIR